MSPLQEAAPTEMEQEVPVFESGQGPCCPECQEPMLPAGLRDGAGSELRLRCFARQSRRGYWVAECIDLDLAAEADSLEAAIRGLGDAIMGYLMVVLEGVQTDQEVPLASVVRRSPLINRVRYWMGYFKAKLLAALSLGRLRSSKKFYQEPLGFGGHCTA